jgi:GDPmannose 4,6-dehydratase
LANFGISEEVNLHALDLNDREAISRTLEELSPTEFYNLAAQSSVRASWEIPLETADLDGLSVARLLEAIRQTAGDCKFYQASSSEMFGLAQDVPQRETTRLYPRSPYGVAKVFGHLITVNYRESYGLHASSGILFNHESPIRSEAFVTRKITNGLAALARGGDQPIGLGNINAQRDWGFAGDYVEGMWRMLQQDVGDDFILATGTVTSIREFFIFAAESLGLAPIFQGEGVDEIAVDQRSGRQLEEAERVRLEEERKRLEEEKQRLVGENQNLDRYRSEFVGRLRDVLGGRAGVRVEVDRFDLSSEVLFPPAEVSLSPEGRAQIADVAAILRDVAQDIPESINWIINVDGHTDNLPSAGQPRYSDSWELSQAQSLSVVRYLIEDFGVPPKRMSANAFGEYQPVSRGNTPEARALNRRIELTLNLNNAESFSRTDSVKSPITSAAGCWVLDVGSPAAQVSVTVGFEVDESGRVLASSFKLLSADGGTGVAVNTAFQAARRAVLRCQGEGYLPPNGLVEEQTVELAFDVGIPAVQLLP